jgi:STE24 endopeptidase
MSLWARRSFRENRKSFGSCFTVLVALAISLIAWGTRPSRTGAQTPAGPSPVATQQSQGSARASAEASVQPAAHAQIERPISGYTLPPDLYKKAKALSRFHFRFNLIGFFYGLFVLWLILELKAAPKFRDWAEKVSRRRFVQAAVFSPFLILSVAILQLPIDMYEHAVSLSYGLSIEGWGSWSWDWTKGSFLAIVLGIILIWILYVVIGQSPRRWWFYFWLISIPILLFLTFVEPFVIEPMFFQFAPLEQKDPSLVVQIERVVQRAGLNIPPDRMFWMKASDKTPTMNAYVSGIGASKRIVVWDTTIDKETTPEIVAVVGHEMGHYVLGHVWKGMLLSISGLLVLLYLGFRSIGWFLGRWGARWHIRGLQDWASLPILLLILSVFSFLGDPTSNAVSRHFEHQADVYGLEVTHGVVPNAGLTAADSFQVEGETYLADPDPSPLNVFLFYDHPPISDRIRLCLTYDPRANGEQPQFVK